MPKIAENFGIEAKSLLALAVNKPIHSLFGALAALSTLISVISFLFTGFEPPTSRSYTTGFMSVFSARVLVFLIISASIGWSISLIGIWLTRSIDETKIIFAHAITGIGALFMATCIQWIFARDITTAPFIVLLSAIVGVTLAVFLAKHNFRQSREVNVEITAARAALLLTFSATASVFVIFVQITGLS